MNISEYDKVKEYDYWEYVEYLQKKYGLGLYNYMTEAFNKNPKATRTKEGLFIHHTMEVAFFKLSDPKVAKLYPYEWQTKEYLCYCDYLEHLLLHIKIYQYPESSDSGIGLRGIFSYLIPEINDIYSGVEFKEKWRENCSNKIINDKDVYLELIYLLFTLLKQNKTKFEFPIFQHNFSNNKDINYVLYKQLFLKIINQYNYNNYSIDCFTVGSHIAKVLFLRYYKDISIEICIENEYIDLLFRNNNIDGLFFSIEKDSKGEYETLFLTFDE